ncbi:complement regulator-acquiring protein [Borreliella burgdorferi]|uniref:complement regulator-acquiring protein n=1 Tax=Borreliella burgdorferi TaxID=139 RepID=UPI000D043B05|nr:complement regulator-acquiring protein [Borreliella burgdorferi]PRR62882.1 blasticidin-S acetyltransferase [Borreliella burgdorferi]
MKCHIIATIFVFLFLACSTDFNTDQKGIKYPPTEKSKPKTEDSKQKELKPKTEKELKKKQQLKNKLLNDLKNSIETANKHKEKYKKRMKEEPEDQYGVQAFKGSNWGPGTEDVSANTERSIRFRRHTYTILSTLSLHELKEFSNIVTNENKLVPVVDMFNFFSSIGTALDITTDSLYPKKDNLDKPDLSDLETLKNSFEAILSAKEKVASGVMQLVRDYKNLKTDINKLKSYLNDLYNESEEQATKAENLEEFIVSKYKL